MALALSMDRAASLSIQAGFQRLFELGPAANHRRILAIHLALNTLTL